MTLYTPSQINTILYSIDCIEELQALADYLCDYGHLYPRFMPEWVEDIRLLMKIV